VSRIDPRVLRTLDLVRDAAVAELAARGWGAFTIEAVATRAGVARSTVYRHWPDRHALLRDALDRHSTQPALEMAGSPRERIEQLLGHLAEVLADPGVWTFQVALLDAGERDDRLRTMQRRFSAGRRRALVEALAAHGAAEPELLADALVGALFFRRLLGEAPMRAADVPGLVDAVVG
jgi:AcrR family transcriptional regulator